MQIHKLFVLAGVGLSMTTASAAFADSVADSQCVDDEGNALYGVSGYAVGLIDGDTSPTTFCATGGVTCPDGFTVEKSTGESDECEDSGGRRANGWMIVEFDKGEAGCDENTWYNDVKVEITNDDLNCDGSACGNDTSTRVYWGTVSGGTWTWSYWDTFDTALYATTTETYGQAGEFDGVLLMRNGANPDTYPDPAWVEVTYKCYQP